MSAAPRQISFNHLSSGPGPSTVYSEGLPSLSLSVVPVVELLARRFRANIVRTQSVEFSVDSTSSKAAAKFAPTNNEQFDADELAPEPESIALSDEVIAEWEGYVTQIDKETFEARLTGLRGTGVEGESEEATIPLRQVRPEYVDLLQPGALFRLCVVDERVPNGSIRSYTELVFRRLPAYRAEDLEKARIRASERMNGLQFD